MHALLIAPTLRGGEGAYRELMRQNPPHGVYYTVLGDFHSGAPGARCRVIQEVLLNRLVRRRTIPDMGFRAIRLRDSFDLVHVHAHPVRLGRLRGTPVVMSEGSSSATYLGEYLGWNDRRLTAAFRRTRRSYRLLRIHDRLLALERVARAYVFSAWARTINIRWGADPNKLEVLAPGFPKPANLANASGETFSFLFIGTDIERKGGFDVIEAFAAVSREHPEARLMLVGSHPWFRNPDREVHGWVSESRRRRVLAQLDELMRSGVAECHGLVPASQIRERFFPSASAFVMPSIAEGFGFTNVEAMSFGLPVISSTVGPIPEIVENERTGLLVKPTDVPGLTAAMDRLVRNRDLGNEMGRQGRNRYEERYTLDRFRRGLGEFYRRAAAT